jgi:hypothetical protein
LTWRRLALLIDRLPPESATKTAIRDAQGAVVLAQQAKSGETGDDGWGSYSNTDMHLASLIDEIRWLRYAVYHAQGGKPKRPQQYPRPGVMPDKARKLAPAAQDYLTDLRQRRDQRRAAEGLTAVAGMQVPAHIAQAPHRRLGPAEREWITGQLAALRAARGTRPGQQPGLEG